jgi:hypothetical protein
MSHRETITQDVKLLTLSDSISLARPVRRRRNTLDQHRLRVVLRGARSGDRFMRAPVRKPPALAIRWTGSFRDPSDFR